MVQLFAGIWSGGTNKSKNGTTIVERNISLDHGPFQFGRVSSEMTLQQTFCQPHP